MPIQRDHTESPSAIAPPERAIERAVERYAGGTVSVAHPASVRRQVDDIVAAVECVSAGTASLVPSGPLDPLELVRALRTETLRAWQEDEPGLLTLMRSFDRVEAGLSEGRRNAVMAEALTPFARELLQEVSHLLRSPLGSIVMLTEMLRDEHLGPLTERQARQVDIIHRAALGVTCTAQDILTLVDGQDRKQRRETFSLVQTMEIVEDVLGPVAASKGKDLAVTVKGESMRLGPAITLRSILLTLGLRSALDGPPGRLELLAEAEGNGDLVRFTVDLRPHQDAPSTSDQPLPPFLPVLRVDELTGDFTLSPGGLGLAAVADLLQALGSELENVTLPGSSRLLFSLILPRA